MENHALRRGNRGLLLWKTMLLDVETEAFCYVETEAFCCGHHACFWTWKEKAPFFCGKACFWTWKRRLSDVESFWKPRPVDVEKNTFEIVLKNVVYIRGRK